MLVHSFYVICSKCCYASDVTFPHNLTFVFAPFRFCPLNDLILVTLPQHQKKSPKTLGWEAWRPSHFPQAVQASPICIFIYCSLHFYGFPFICFLQNTWTVVNVFLIPIINSNNNNNNNINNYYY